MTNAVNSDDVSRMFERRSVRKIRFTIEEWTTILTRAADCGMPPARYVRDAALGHVPKIRRPQANAELLRQLARIGNNLNQMTHIANIRGQVQEEALLRTAVEELLITARRIE